MPMPKKVGYLQLTKEHPIDQSTVLYVKFSLEHFKKTGVECVVLDLDTPGGEAFAALKITEMLKDLDMNDHIPVIAFIDNWAISAGAMLAYSCRYIGATPEASMGAAEPVLSDGEGEMTSASEKINSALRSEFANLARFWKRNPFIAEAMVDKDILLIKRGDQILKLDHESDLKKSDQLIAGKGKLLTLNALQLQEYHVADFEADFLKTYPLFQEATWISYSNWKIDFFAFLLHPAVASLLLMGLVFGIYLEMQHPGLILPAIVAGCCGALILLSKFSLETVNWLETLILLVGLALLLVEIFILPGFGAVGILGIMLMVGGTVVLMLPHFDAIQFAPEWNLAALAIVDQLVWFCGALIIGCVVVFLMARRALKRFVLVDQQVKEISHLPLIGSLGESFTELKPSGKVEIEGQIYEATTEGRYLEKGKAIRVIRQEGNRLWVR